MMAMEFEKSIGTDVYWVGVGGDDDTGLFGIWDCS